ncbi:MAG: hypothetical protein F4X11_26200 [Acidobacteria bacterium]|nr:hypothetical protein [Acidobacteriota bacterium]
MLRDLSAEERASLLDLAAFDRIDEDLTRAVLGSTDALARVVALPAFDGLLLPIGGDRTVRRLHPLRRDHCLDLLLRENPGRRRSLHRRLASPLAERGHLTPAWRHAAEADDTRLPGRLIERFGAYELWMREGVTRIISAARLSDRGPHPAVSTPWLPALHQPVPGVEVRRGSCPLRGPGAVRPMASSATAMAAILAS